MHYLLSLVPFDHRFTQEEKQFMEANIDLYTQCRIKIQDLQDEGILVSGVPIKLHTLHQKTQLIANSSECLLYYNNWSRTNAVDYALPYTAEKINQIAMSEHRIWTQDQGTTLTFNDISKQKLLQSDLKGL
jgi:hypothetical protein